MRERDDSYADVLGAEAGPARARLIQDLDAVYRADPPPQVRAAIARRLDERARAQGRLREALAARPAAVPPWVSRRGASAVAACAIVLAGLLGYLRVQAPTAVSAATILQRAATARPAATSGEVLHQTGTLYLNGPFDLPDQHLFTPPQTLAVDQWTQLDADGAVGRQVTIMTSSGILVARGLQVGEREQIYGALQNAISTQSVAPSQTYMWLANPLAIGDVPGLVAAAQTSASGQLRLLPQQTIDGAVVDVVQIRTSPDPANRGFPHPVAAAGDAALITTMYIDAATYALRGVDVATQRASGQQVLKYRLRVAPPALVPLAGVPASTFTLGAPASARALPSRLDGSAGASAAGQRDQVQLTPDLLLAHAPAGLELGQFSRDTGSLFSSASFTYCGGSGRCAQQPLYASQFAITFAQSRPPSAHVPLLLATGQPLALTIAGHSVQAYYLEEQAPRGARRLIYQQGSTTVELYSQGLDRTAFFAAVADLVDLQAHPELLPAKWRALGIGGS